MQSLAETSSILDLVPCAVTFFSTPDKNVFDSRNVPPPACVAEAIKKKENQRLVLQFLGRATALGAHTDFQTSGDLPVAIGKPASIGAGPPSTMNGIKLQDYLLFDNGVIQTLSRNDYRDPVMAEVLRRLTYWTCLDDHLRRNPSLTRFALRTLDNKRPLPIIGVAPGIRPAWVAEGLRGWFAPPATRLETEEQEPNDALPDSANGVTAGSEVVAGEA